MVTTAGSAQEAGRWFQDAGSGCKFWLDETAELKGSISWSGGCAEGRAEGKGAVSLSQSGFTKPIYTGQLHGGKPHGFGIHINSLGTRYEGQWRDGLRHGRGSQRWGLTSERPGDQYQGDWSDGRRHGQGTYHWSLNSPRAGYRYVGAWANDKMHGEGSYGAPDGSLVEGSFAENQLVGPGRCRTYDGRWAECELRGGRFEVLRWLN
jgi:hypothetical protein